MQILRRNPGKTHVTIVVPRARRRRRWRGGTPVYAALLGGGGGLIWVMAVAALFNLFIFTACSPRGVLSDIGRCRLDSLVGPAQLR